MILTRLACPPEASWDDKLAHAPDNIYRAGRDYPEPTLADFWALAAEPNIDYAVLHQEFPGLFIATNGSVLIYALPGALRGRPCLDPCRLVRQVKEFCGDESARDLDQFPDPCRLVRQVKQFYG